MRNFLLCFVLTCTIVACDKRKNCDSPNLPDLEVGFIYNPNVIILTNVWELSIYVKNVADSDCNTLQSEETTVSLGVEYRRDTSSSWQNTSFSSGSSSTEFLTEKIKKLSPGESQKLPLKLKLLDPGQYRLRVKLDPLNIVQERNENNNSITTEQSQNQIK